MINDNFIKERKEFIRGLKNKMEERHITEEGLAVCLGTTEDIIKKYLSGDADASLADARKMAIIFDCSLDDLFEEVNEDNNY